MSEKSHHHNSAAHSHSRPKRAKRGGPSLTHRPDPTANPTISSASVPRQRWVPNRGKQMAATLSSKRGTDENGAFFIEKNSDFPLKDIACVLFAQTKDAKIVCVIVCQITRTRFHTLLKRLASARHDNREKTVLLPDCTLQTKQSVKTKKVDDVFSQRPLYCGRAGSDVIGCRRPTGGVFICMLHTRVTLTACPIATPRGHSSTFP